MPTPDETKAVPGRAALSRGEIAVGVAAFVAWCLLFNVGNTVGAAPLFAALNSSATDPLRWLLSFLAIHFVFTPTNVLMLSIAAGLTGTVLGRLELPPPNSEERAPAPGNRWLKAIFGSFMVYLVVLSGVLAILGMPFKLPEITDTKDVEKAQVAYRVTSSFCSLFSMVEGSRPFILGAIAGRIQWLLTPRTSAATGAGKPDGSADSG